VDQIKAEIGKAVSLDAIEQALKTKKYKVLTFTHVDTSTGNEFYQISPAT
jgi:alanine-glyoxylate transaminase/serine-glyoxylate transaminase/serine-pyruvate transaminase